MCLCWRVIINILPTLHPAPFEDYSTVPCRPGYENRDSIGGGARPPPPSASINLQRRRVYLFGRNVLVFIVTRFPLGRWLIFVISFLRIWRPNPRTIYHRGTTTDQNHTPNLPALIYCAPSASFDEFLSEINRVLLPKSLRRVCKVYHQGWLIIFKGL